MNRLELQKLYRKRTNNICTKRYEKTERGFIMRMYRNMKSRITGIQKAKYHLYANKYLLPKHEFYGFVDRSPQFKRLFKHWVTSHYDRKLTPSVNRIDPSIGYEVGNIEFITHSENSRLGALNK